MKKQNLFYTLLLIGIVVILANSCKKEDEQSEQKPKVYGTVSDIDGNVYKTVTIGDQTWMIENLKVTRFRNGDSIIHVTNNNSWATLTKGAYCSYENVDTVNVAIYGRLYNYYAIADTNNICPNGWHIPTDAEWMTLISYLGGENVAGGKLKKIDSTWNMPNTSANNETGFSALPGGFRNFNGSFIEIGYNSSWWSSTSVSFSSAYYQDLSYNNGQIYKGVAHFRSGFYVRCVKD
jgi:uncharacterized protein (TIGR02145 family)